MMDTALEFTLIQMVVGLLLVIVELLCDMFGD